MAVIQVMAEVQIPSVPSFIRYADGDGTLRVGDIDDDGLRSIAHEWTNALLERARKQREAPDE